MARAELPTDKMATDAAIDALDVALAKFKDACSMAIRYRQLNKKGISAYKLNYLAQHLSQSFQAAADAAEEAEESQVIAQYGPARFLSS